MANWAKAFYKPPHKPPIYFEGELRPLANTAILKDFVIANFEGTEILSIPPVSEPFLFHEIECTQEPYNKTEGKKQYLNYLNLIQQQISDGNFQKIVAARSRSIPRETINPNKFIQTAIQSYPDAYLTVFQTATDLYMGISPEILLKGNLKTGQFQTVALAGTASTENLAQTLGKKEQDEQGFILTHFEQVFSENAWEYDVAPRQKITAGKLEHFVNEIRFSAPNSHWLDIVRQIHPTPAVGGYPFRKAIDFIQKNETLSRGFYSGYSGAVSSEEILLSVNLRCLTVQNGQTRLWAGAGITQDSNPDKEWQETEMKMQTMEDILESNK